MNKRSVELGAVAEFINGAAFRPEDWGDSGLPIIRIQNLTDPSKPYNRTTRPVSEHLRVQPGDLLVSWSATLGVFEWAGPEEGLLNQHIFRVIPSLDKVDKRYLRHVLERALLDMRRHLHGATMQHVNRREFLGTKLPLPGLPEQRRIAEVLDRADDLRNKRRTSLAELDTLTHSIFFDLFGDPATNPKRWHLVCLKDVLSIALRNGLSPSHSGRVTAKVLTLTAVTGSRFNEGAWKLSTFQSVPPADQAVDENDFLICRGNGNIRLVGKGHFPIKPMPDVTFPDTMIAARVNEQRIDRLFLEHIWNSSAIRGQLESSARTTNGTYKVNQPMLEAISFVCPPISLQREFAVRLAAVEKVRSAHTSSLVEMEALFTSLQNHAFRGEL
jgi:type I restriction enzyme, S subunit